MLIFPVPFRCRQYVPTTCMVSAICTIPRLQALCMCMGMGHTMKIKQQIFCISLSNPMHPRPTVEMDCVCRTLPSLAAFLISVGGAFLHILRLGSGCLVEYPTYHRVQDVSIGGGRSRFLPHGNDQMFERRGHFVCLSTNASE